MIEKIGSNGTFANVPLDHVFLSFIKARYKRCSLPLKLITSNSKCGDTSKTRKARIFRRERTWTYVTKKKRKPDAVLRRIYAFRRGA